MARPRLGDDKLVRGSISLPRDHWTALDKVARQRGVSMSSVVRQFVDEGLARRPREVARALGMEVSA